MKTKMKRCSGKASIPDGRRLMSSARVHSGAVIPTQFDRRRQPVDANGRNTGRHSGSSRAHGGRWRHLAGEQGAQLLWQAALSSGSPAGRFAGELARPAARHIRLVAAGASRSFGALATRDLWLPASSGLAGEL